jgi:hypothetical protein
MQDVFNPRAEEGWKASSLSTSISEDHETESKAFLKSSLKTIAGASLLWQQFRIYAAYVKFSEMDLPCTKPVWSP